MPEKRIDPPADPSIPQPSARPAPLPLDVKNHIRAREAVKVMLDRQKNGHEGRAVEDREFDKPVYVVTGRHNSVIRAVKTTAQACDYLLNKWPAGRAGEKHRAARMACMKVLEGQRKAAIARKAFAEAADEAQILVDERAYGSG